MTTAASKQTATILVTTSEEERVEKLGKYFRSHLSDWLSKVVVGVRFSPGVARECTLAMLEHAASVLIATSDSAAVETDEETTDRCERVAKQLLEVLEREVLS